MLTTSEDKFVHVWFEVCPSYRSRKKETEGKFFEAEAVGRGWEMFPRFPFFYWSTLDNTEIRLGPNLYERRGKHNYWNRILFSFVWLFRGVTTVIRIKNDGKIVKIGLVWRTNSLLLGQILCYLDKFFVTWTNSLLQMWTNSLLLVTKNLSVRLDLSLWNYYEKQKCLSIWAT